MASQRGNKSKRTDSEGRYVQQYMKCTRASSSQTIRKYMHDQERNLLYIYPMWLKSKKKKINKSSCCTLKYIFLNFNSWILFIIMSWNKRENPQDIWMCSTSCANLEGVGGIRTPPPLLAPPQSTENFWISARTWLYCNYVVFFFFWRGGGVIYARKNHLYMCKLYFQRAL